MQKEIIEKQDSSEKEVKFPVFLNKLEKRLNLFSKQLSDQKAMMDTTFSEFREFEKMTKKLIEKQKSVYKKDPNKPPRKSGFAMPVHISENLREFMKEAENTKVARTSATQYIMKYIKEHGLKNPENRKQILPDEQLWKLLGEDARTCPIITDFNIQKFMNQHFIK